MLGTLFEKDNAESNLRWAGHHRVTRRGGQDTLESNTVMSPPELVSAMVNTPRGKIRGRHDTTDTDFPSLKKNKIKSCYTRMNMRLTDDETASFKNLITQH